MSLDFIAIDFETANRRHGSPCQVGMALVRDGRLEATWGSLMRPPRGRGWFDPDCCEIHGIGEGHLEGQPTFEQLWPHIAARLTGRRVMAHNAAFDVSVIREATSYCHFDWPTFDFGCSLLLARRYYDLPEYTLDAVANAAGVPLDHHHDAVHDAVACALITLDMARRASVSSLDDLLVASGVAWGRLAPDHHEPSRPTKPVELVDPELSPTLF